jgi:hypothetical protein
LPPAQREVLRERFEAQRQQRLEPPVPRPEILQNRPGAQVVPPVPPRIERPVVERPGIDRPAIERPRVDTPRVAPPRIEAPRIERPAPERFKPPR